MKAEVADSSSGICLQDAKEGNDGLARFGIKTYTNKEMNSMNDVSTSTSHCQLIESLQWRRAGHRRDHMPPFVSIFLIATSNGSITTVRFADPGQSVASVSSLTRHVRVLQIAGGDVPALMTQIAQASKVNFTVVVVSSRKLGTQAQELSGAPGFIVNSAAAAAPTPIASPAPK